MPTTPRLFVFEDLSAGRSFGLDAEQSGYLLRVLRLQAGAEVRLFNGRDGEWTCVIAVTAAKRAEVTPTAQTRAQIAPASPAMTLLFAPVKKDQTDLIVEKATELGAVSIRPVLTERTQTHNVRVDRFRKIALEAAEQTERLDLPEILEPLALQRALGALPADTALIFCDEQGDPGDPEAAAMKVLASLRGRPAAILTGPEGGFSAFERTGLRERPGAVSISLGPRILRAETAAISAMTLWQAVCGDWDSGPNGR